MRKLFWSFTIFLCFICVQGCVASSGAEAIKFSFIIQDKEFVGQIDPSNDIKITVPYGTDISKLAPKIVVSPGAKISPASGTEQDFSQPVVYYVTARDGTAVEYCIRVAAEPSPEREFLEIEFAEQRKPPVVSVQGNLVLVTVPHDAELTNLIPNIKISDHASISPEDGRLTDFSQAVLYTVTAQNGSSQTYTVSVSNAPSDEKDILAFDITNLEKPIKGSIQGQNIMLQVPAKTGLTSLVPEILISKKASISPASGQPADFSGPVVYTVTAEDGTTTIYTVTASTFLSADNTIQSFALNYFNETYQGTVLDNTIEVIVPCVPFDYSPRLMLVKVKLPDGATMSPKLDGWIGCFEIPEITVTAEDGSTRRYTVKTYDIKPSWPVSKSSEIKEELKKIGFVFSSPNKAKYSLNKCEFELEISGKQWIFSYATPSYSYPDWCEYCLTQFFCVFGPYDWAKQYAHNIEGRADYVNKDADVFHQGVGDDGFGRLYIRITR